MPHKIKLERAARLRQAVSKRQHAFLEAQLRLPLMLVAADNPHGPLHEAEAETPPTATPAAFKGVNEYYAACIIQQADTVTAHGGMPPGLGLLPVRPVALADKGLIVALAQDEENPHASGHVILSSIQPETISQRFAQEEGD